jgi:hypothetical protein
MRCPHPLPGFKATLLLVGAVHVLLGLSIVVRGAASMEPFGVPASTIALPHYDDAVRWIYLHQTVLGCVCLLVALFSEGGRFQRAFARLMCAAHAVYAFLDVRSAESPLGTSLYTGPASNFPALVSVVLALLFLHVSFCRSTRA